MSLWNIDNGLVLTSGWSVVISNENPGKLEDIINLILDFVSSSSLSHSSSIF